MAETWVRREFWQPLSYRSWPRRLWQVVCRWRRYQKICQEDKVTILMLKPFSNSEGWPKESERRDDSGTFWYYDRYPIFAALSTTEFTFSSDGSSINTVMSCSANNSVMPPPMLPPPIMAIYQRQWCHSNNKWSLRLKKCLTYTLNLWRSCHFEMGFSFWACTCDDGTGVKWSHNDWMFCACSLCARPEQYKDNVTALKIYFEVNLISTMFYI